MRLEEEIWDMISRSYEEEWFEFKENWFDPVQFGYYVSALSNYSAMRGKTYGYFVWGINDKSHEITGTDVNVYRNYKSEPWKNFLARNLSPSIGFDFKELSMDGKRLVVCVIPAARKVPTYFQGIRYGRIGSSLVNLANYPEQEGLLWKVLLEGYPTMTNTESPIQNLTFHQLKAYYLGKLSRARRPSLESPSRGVSHDD